MAWRYGLAGWHNATFCCAAYSWLSSCRSLISRLLSGLSEAVTRLSEAGRNARVEATLNLGLDTLIEVRPRVLARDLGGDIEHLSAPVLARKSVVSGKSV